MIINVRGCTSRSGIIVSRLTKNEEGTGYSSFNSKKFIIKNKTDILAAIKKTLILTRKIPVIKADAFVSTIDKVSRKNMCDTSTKLIVKTINEENMQSDMLSLSYIHFNGKPLPQVKAINIVNGNMYFMIKKGPNYILELIENEKIKCMISINSLVKLYRLIKLGKKLPKNFSKGIYTLSPYDVNTESTRNTWQRPYRGAIHAERALHSNQARPANPPAAEESIEEPISINSDFLTYNFSDEEIVEIPRQTLRPNDEELVEIPIREAERRPERPEERITRIETILENHQTVLETRQETAEAAQEETPTEEEQPNQARVSNQNRYNDRRALSSVPTEESEEDGEEDGEEEEGEEISPRTAFIDYLREHRHAFTATTAAYITSDTTSENSQ